MAPLCLALVVVTRNKVGGDVAESSKELDFHKVFSGFPWKLVTKEHLLLLLVLLLPTDEIWFGNLLN